MGTNFTTAEVEAAIAVLNETGNWDGWGEWSMSVENPDYDSTKDSDYRTRTNLSWISKPVQITLRGEEFEVIDIEQHGGEGQGDRCHCTFRVGSQLFTKHGYYASYDGYYWDGDLVEVHPVQKVVTVYEAI